MPSDPAASAPDGASDRSLSRRSKAQATFVGRQTELQQLQVGFEEAANGHGVLIMLVGEPGIGKSALCEQLCRFVAAAGGKVLVGHCYEEGSFRPPYQAFVEVFGSYLREDDSGELVTDLGATAIDLARIVPTLRERRNLTPGPPGDPEEDRWRLLQAATDLLHRIASGQPLLLILEDLHDADRGTLDMLLYLARNLQGAPILVVGTYRDVEVDRAHPLSAALSQLHRVSDFARIRLRGLSTDEVQRVLAGTSQQTIPQAFAELVHRQTDGNPLFVHQMLRYVIEEGLVERRNGALRRVSEETLVGRIPEGLRDAVGKRLSRLSESTNRVLSVASVIGREFPLEALRQVVSLPEEELEGALEEAVGAALVEERLVIGATITYRFGHAFFQQTLYDEILAPRRIRLHQQVARALEAVYAHQLDEHATELAEHYAFSSDTSDLAKAVHYGDMAARQAREVLAYGEAARLIERTLVVQDLVDPKDAAKRCDLLLAFGEALLYTGETERVITRVAPEALTLAEALGDRTRSFRACRLALDSRYTLGGRTGAALPEYLAWAERAREYADPDSIDRIYADLAVSNAWRELQGRFQEARALRLEALALARRLGDPEALFRSANSLLIQFAPQHFAEAVPLAKEAARWPREGASGQTLGLLLWVSGILMLASGDRALAEKLWREIEQAAQRTHVVAASVFAGQRDPLLAIVDGRLEDALALLQRFVERADASGASVRGRQVTIQMQLTAAIYLGRAEDWLTWFEDYAALAGDYAQTSAFIAARALCLAHVGRREEARVLVGPLLDRVYAGTYEEEMPMVAVTLLLRVATMLGQQREAQTLRARLDCVANTSAMWASGYTCVARHLGDTAVLVADRSAARQYYLQALEAAGKIRFRPEMALARLSLAELLVGDVDDASRAEGMQHLNLAIPELRDMHMQPALEHALRLRETDQPAAIDQHVRRLTSDMLTAREREIAGLTADGLSNREIAERLVISEGTVELHVKHILSKLDFRSRSQVAGWFRRQDDERPLNRKS